MEAHMDFRIYKDPAGHWRWSLAADQTQVLTSERGFSSEAACRQSIATLRQEVLAASAVRVNPGNYLAAA
jgi:uncharacterized protein YegP (UPF0339 family)